MAETHDERCGDSCHLAIACGGTGGHFYPTLAVARKFTEMGHRVTLLVAGKHAGEQAAIAAKYGFASREVPAVRLEAGLLATLSFPFQLLGCVWAARRILTEDRPDLLLGMGSFAAVPACLAYRGGRRWFCMRAMPSWARPIVFSCARPGRSACLCP